jgi:AraC-like DNA-binding protein
MMQESPREISTRRGMDLEIYLSRYDARSLVLFDVYAAGVSAWRRGMELIREKSEICAIEMVLEGEGEMVASGTTHHLVPGDIYLLHFDENHVYRTGDCENWKKIWIAFRHGFVTEAMRHLRLLEISKLRVDPDLQAAYEELFFKILHLMRDKPSGFRIQTSSLAYSLLLMLSRDASEEERHPLIPPAIARTIRYAEQHLGDPLNMDILARVAGCSRVHLTRLFKKHLGIHTRDWLIDTRMRYARMMLNVSDKTVNEISGMVGYWDPYHFSTAFRRVTGMSPTEYRRQSRGKTIPPEEDMKNRQGRKDQ